MIASDNIVITGIGLVLPPGTDVAEITRRAVRGDSAIGALERFAPPHSGGRSSAEVPPFELSPFLRVRKNEKFMSRSVACAMRAALNAVGSAGGFGDTDPRRVGVYTAGGQTGLEPAEFFGALE